MGEDEGERLLKELDKVTKQVTSRAGFARPVRMPAKFSLVDSMDFSIWLLA